MVIGDESTDIILRELIEAVDLDTSIFINENELAAVCDLDARDLKDIFQQLDHDKDGKISVEEFILNYKKFQQVAKEKVTDADVEPAHIKTDEKATKEKLANGNRDEKTQKSTSKLDSTKSSNGTATPKTTQKKKTEEADQDSAAIRKAAEFYLGQEYLDDLYEIARSRNDPMLLESLESFLAATVEGLLQKQSDNEKLDTALKRATEKNSAIALELEAEMEHQVAMLEEKIREEEQRKLEEQKQEAQGQMVAAQRDLKDMEQKVKDLEEQIEEKKNEANIPETIIEEIQSKERENKILQKKLVEFQTQMALMRTEVAQMKAVYDEQADRLASERGAVLTCVTEQENLTRQLHLLHEANKRLHDTNDDLRSALDTKRSNSSFAEESSFLPRNSHMYNSFRSDPGVRRSPSGSCSNNGTDEDSKNSIPYDDEDTDNTKNPVNETPLLAELLAVDKSYAYDSPVPMMAGARSPVNSTLMEPVSSVDKETFIKQLEILCETNKRLGESNDELRDALGLLSGQIRMDQEMMRSSSSAGCQSAPITPMRTRPSNGESPQHTSSPRKVLLTKSGYQSSSLQEAQSMPDVSTDSPKETDGNKSDLENGTPATTGRHEEVLKPKNCSPSDWTSSSTTRGQLPHNCQNSGDMRKGPPSEYNPHPRTPPGTSKVSPAPDKEPICRRGHHRNHSDDSQNSNERTCDCGNEIYGSDISICDFCLDSITSAVDELTTDYASSLSDDDGSTIYEGKSIDADLYRVTDNGIYPLQRLYEREENSPKLDKSVQCTAEYGFNESDITDQRSVKKQCLRLDCKEIDCKCPSNDETLLGKTPNTSSSLSLKSVNWKDNKEPGAVKGDSGSSAGKPGTDMDARNDINGNSQVTSKSESTGDTVQGVGMKDPDFSPTTVGALDESSSKSGIGSSNGSSETGSGTVKSGSRSGTSKSRTGSDNGKSDLNSSRLSNSSSQKGSKSDSTGDTVRSVNTSSQKESKSDNTGDTSRSSNSSSKKRCKPEIIGDTIRSSGTREHGSSTERTLGKLDSSSSTERPDVSQSYKFNRNLQNGSKPESAGAIVRSPGTQNCDIPPKDGGVDNRSSDDIKYILKISLSENDLRNIGVVDGNDGNVVSPTQVAIVKVTPTSPSQNGRHNASQPMDTSRNLKSSEIADRILHHSDSGTSTRDSQKHSQSQAEWNDNTHDMPTSSILETTPLSSDTDRTKSSKYVLPKIPSSSEPDYAGVMPPNICEQCRHEIRIGNSGVSVCLCNNNHNDVNRVSYRLLAETTILTDSDDSNDYSEQEATQSVIRKRITPVGNDTQDATYETSDRQNDMTEHSDWISDGYSTHTSILHSIEAELSMYSRRQPDEVVDEDDMDDEELVRLVDQTNEDDLSQSITDDPIYIEEKVIREPIENRGDAVGADASDDSSDGGTPDRMYKLVLAGNAAVGKSSFIIRLCRNKFYSALNSTLGVDFQMKTINCDGSKVALQLWDTAGQERFRSIAKSYFRRVDGVILLYDVTCENSFVDVREWLESIESGSSKEVPVIICGNKTDLRYDASQNGMSVVSRQQGLKLAQDVNALFIETSAKDGTNIHKACVELTRKLQKIDDDQMAEVTINLEEKQKPKSRCCR